MRDNIILFDGGNAAARNPEGIFINTNYFREEAINFRKHKRYNNDRVGSVLWRQYWDEQLRRCTEGYSVGGVSITGHHYNYLNFSPIMKAEEIGTNIAAKRLGFPDFWDGDYNYFWALEIARKGILGCNLVSEGKSNFILSLEGNEQENELKKIFDGLGLRYRIRVDHLTGGRHLIVGKARRKGYSYKNGSICANTYNTVRNSLSIIGASDKKYLYPKGTMSMSSYYLDFYNTHTAWVKSRDFINRIDHRKASFMEEINGVKTEQGFLSEIMALTFQDNPDAARGKDSNIVLFEEAGAFPNLREAYKATEPGLRAGKYTTGTIVIFGTGGDMESGTADFASMFYDPDTYNLLAIENELDDDALDTYCGFFHPVQWNYEGFYDEQGNSDIKAALENENAIRDKIIKNSANGSSVLQGRVQEYATKPSEAFLMVSTNDFPIVELRNRHNSVIANQLHHKKGTPVTLYREDNKVHMKMDMNGELTPIWDYNPKTTDLTGCVVIYEPPVTNAPKGLYKIGYDPYRQDKGSSLAAILVYKGNMKGKGMKNTIVAEYVGRPSTADAANRIAELLAELYGGEIMYENEVTHVKGYFLKKNKLHLLAAQPDTVISKNIKHSTVARIYGCHMNDKMKDAGEKYIKEFLLREIDYDENEELIIGLETLYSPGLIEELIYYNRKGNFDRVMALMQVMFAIEEEDNKEYKMNDDKPKIYEQLESLRLNQFKKR